MSAVNQGFSGGKGGPALYQKPIIPLYNKFGKRIPPPMALLPKSLLPVKFGGDGDGTEDPEDFKQDVTGAQIRDKYSTFLKRKGKEELKREAAKQQEDAQFLDGLFGDNLSDDSQK